MKKLPRFEFLVLGRSMPSTRFRVLQFLPFLVERRIAFRVFEMKPEREVAGLRKLFRFLHYLRVFQAMRRCDLVFVQKPGFIVHRWIYVRALFRLGRRVVFDLDDAVFFDHDSGRPRPRALLDKLEFILRRSHLVIAGNAYLAEFAGRYNAAVEVVPTVIDCDRYRPSPVMPPRPTVTIGWMGTASNLKYLFPLLPVLERVLRDSAVRFLVVSSEARRPKELDFSAQVEYKAWSAATEVDDLQRFDIGLMPLADDPHTRGKCGFKLLQYMAVGIPVVASPVGANRRIVEEGRTGYLAGDDDAWRERITALCRDGDLRRRLGAMGREKAEREYSLRRWAGTWVGLLTREAGE